MRLQPIVCVTNMQRAVDFYARLGLSMHPTGNNTMWTAFDRGDSRLALHYVERLPAQPVGRVGLSLLATEPLENHEYA